VQHRGSLITHGLHPHGAEAVENDVDNEVWPVKGVEKVQFRAKMS
jgi:hypothetical protein